jgi:hypothetical protein
MGESPRPLVIAIENLSFAAIGMAVFTGFIWGMAFAGLLCAGG